eukprot:RCo032127
MQLSLEPTPAAAEARTEAEDFFASGVHATPAAQSFGIRPQEGGIEGLTDAQHSMARLGTGVEAQQLSCGSLHFQGDWQAERPREEGVGGDSSPEPEPTPEPEVVIATLRAQVEGLQRRAEVAESTAAHLS